MWQGGRFFARSETYTHGPHTAIANAIETRSWRWSIVVKVTSSQSRLVRAAVFFAAFYVCFFSPVLFSGKVLAPPPDATFFYYPHYNSPVHLWDPLLMTGYPAMADPQLMNWYPLALLLRLIPGSWNSFIVLAYVLASWFMYLFVRQVTGKDFAGLVSGLIFGLGGFMNAHLEHVTMIQTAVWIPAMLLCLERLANGIRWRWMALGGLSTGACVLAGHPQIALYGITLVLGYIIVRGFSAACPAWQYYAASAITIGAGLALSAIQILPAAEIAGISTRASLSFTEFSQYALPPYQLATLLFPFLFGGAGPAFLSGIPYFGSSSITEVAGYVGFAGLVLAAIAVISHRTTRVFFWLASMAVSLIAAMGAATPFGRVLYALPAFGQFRAEARFLLIFGIAAAVLAGYGVASIVEGKNPVRNALLTLGAGLGLILYAARIALVNAAPLRKAALASGARHFSASPFANPWIGGPLLIGCCMCVVLALLIGKPKSLALRAALVLAVVLELSDFSWYGRWRFESPPAEVFQEPGIVRRIGPAARRMHARWVPVRGDLGTPAEAPGDLPILWKLPSLAKYGPLLPARYKELMTMEANGRFRGQWWEPENRALDIAGGRFVAVPEVRITGEEIFRGIRFSSQDLTLSVGNGCGAAAASATIPVPQPQEIRGLALVTLTGCSVGLEQGTPLAEVRLQGIHGASILIPIRAGVETAEWAAGCADVAPAMRHRAADVYSRYSVPRGEGVCQGQTYAAILNLRKPITTSAMEIRWLPQSMGVLKINKISLLNAKTGRSQPLSQQDVRFGDPVRWRHLDKADGVAVYENMRAQPRVWLVPETLSVPRAQIVRAIQTSRLPDGRPYDPAAVALVEESLAFQASAPDPGARASLVEDKGASVEIRTVSNQPAFLVLADSYYPGWRATVNGRAAHIYQTNYIQRGIPIPPGTSSVRFEFHPAQFYIGGAISLGTLAGMLCMSVLWYRRGRYKKTPRLVSKAGY